MHHFHITSGLHSRLVLHHLASQIYFRWAARPLFQSLRNHAQDGPVAGVSGHGVDVAQAGLPEAGLHVEHVVLVAPRLRALHQRRYSLGQVLDGFGPAGPKERSSVSTPCSCDLAHRHSVFPGQSETSLTPYNNGDVWHPSVYDVDSRRQIAVSGQWSAAEGCVGSHSEQHSWGARMRGRWMGGGSLGVVVTDHQHAAGPQHADCLLHHGCDGLRDAFMHHKLRVM